MSREIKFRVWEKSQDVTTEGLMWTWKEITRAKIDGRVNFPARWIDPEDDNYIFMQFIGLQDKDGNDIYERDIVKPQQSPRGPFLISYVDGCFILEGPLGSKHGIVTKWKPVKVLGNEFENRELLDT